MLALQQQTGAAVVASDDVAGYSSLSWVDAQREAPAFAAAALYMQPARLQAWRAGAETLGGLTAEVRQLVQPALARHGLVLAKHVASHVYGAVLAR